GLVGRREIVVSGVRYGDGCVALVRAAFAEAGEPLPASAADAPSLLAVARERGAVRRSRPAAGDLVFLSDRPGGPAEHVGLVASVGEDGTALVLHHTERGVARLHLNAGQPWKARTESGKALNDVLVVGGGRVTAGRLLVGWATLL
ncbi:MAG TPA: NlpC/P60 family protein, partial [Anaeromyxobacter sp.]